MDHFPGITPQERFNNELLREIKETNRLLNELLERNAQAVEPMIDNITTIKPGRAVAERRRLANDKS